MNRFIAYILFLASIFVANTHGIYNADHKLKILVVAGIFPKASEVFVLNQITGLLERGHEVDICATKRGGQEEMQTEVTTYNLMDRVVYKRPADLTPYDVILIEFGTFAKPYIELKKKNMSKAKLAICLRGYDVGWALYQDSHFYDEIIKNGDLFLPVCDYFKNRFIQEGCDPQKIEVLHSVIRCDKFTFKNHAPNEDEPIRIISTGRFVGKKGLEYAIEAIAQLQKRIQRPIEYTIIGRGPLKQYYQDLIEQYDMKKNIKVIEIIRKNELKKRDKNMHLIDWCTQDELIHHLENAHIFLLPSVTEENGNQEGIPNALKEAMAMGLPVVSTYHSGIPELITDGVSGLLAPEKDAQALAQKLEYLINHPELWPLLGTAGRKKVEQEFEYNAGADRLEKLLLNLVWPE